MPQSSAEVENTIKEALLPSIGDLPDQTAETIVKNFLWLSSSTRALAVQRSGRYMNFLARAAELPDQEVRRNALEILQRTGGTRVLRGLAAFLKDSLPALRLTAAQAMITEIDEHLRLLESVKAEAGLLASPEVASNRKAYLEAVYLALNSYPVHKNDDLLEALLRLDGGPHGFPMEMLRRTRDPRRQFVLELLQTRTSPVTIPFLCRMLADAVPRVRNRAQQIISQKNDPHFIRAFLEEAISEQWPNLPNTLPELTQVGWLEPGHPLLTSQPPSVQLKAIAFLMSTGLPWHTKIAKLQELADRPLQRASRRPSRKRQPPQPPPDLPLDAPDEETQLEATRALAVLHVPQKHKLLVNQLSSPYKSVRRLALRELAQGSFRRYLAMFEKMDEETRKMVGRTVAKIDDSMLDELESELFGLDPERRLKALKIIETVGVEKKLEKHLVDLVSDADVKVRAAVAKLLALVGSGTTLKALISALSDTDPRVQANTLEAFETINESRFNDLLRPFLRHTNNRVRANAAKALWTLGERKDALDVFTDMLQNGNLKMRLSAAWALRGIADPRARQLLESAAFGDPSMRVRSMAQESLEGLEKQQA